MRASILLTIVIACIQLAPTVTAHALPRPTEQTSYSLPGDHKQIVDLNARNSADTKALTTRIPPLEGNLKNFADWTMLFVLFTGIALYITHTAARFVSHREESIVEGLMVAFHISQPRARRLARAAVQGTELAVEFAEEVQDPSNTGHTKVKRGTTNVILTMHVGGTTRLHLIDIQRVSSVHPEQAQLIPGHNHPVFEGYGACKGMC